MPGIWRKGYPKVDEITELRANAEALFGVREQSAGMPVVNHKAMADLANEKRKLGPLARMHRLAGEKRAVALFDHYLLNGNDRLDEIVDDDEIERAVPEYRVPGGACDRALVHASGRLTLVEIKDCTSTRDIVAGIGQVLVYAAKAERTTNHHPIVPVLAVLTERDDDIARACELAGVEYFPLGDLTLNLTLSRIAALAVGE